MKRSLNLLFSQQGSMMLVAVMIFLIVTLLGTMMMNIAGMESKIAINDIRAEQARQAADAGVEIARDVVRNCMMEAKDPPAFRILEFENGTTVQIVLRKDQKEEGLLWITSVGKCPSSQGMVTRKTAEVGIYVGAMPGYPLQSHSLQAMGKYFATIPSQDVAPVWKPSGIIRVLDENGNTGKVAVGGYEDDLNPEDLAKIFDDGITTPENLIQMLLRQTPVMYPDKDFHSADFMAPTIRVNSPQRPIFQKEQFEHYRKLAKVDSEWQYIASNSPLLEDLGNHHYKLIIDELEQKNVFIESLPGIGEGGVVILDFTTTLSWGGTGRIGWTCFDTMINSLLNSTGTFFNQFQNRLAGFSIVCPTNLEIGLDSLLFEAADPEACLFILSGQDVRLSVDPVLFNGLSRILSNQGSDGRNFRAFIMAGRNLTIQSSPQNLTIRGMLKAGNQITLKMDYFEEDNSFGLRETEKQIDIVLDPSVMKAFPDSWAYLGLAPIVSYRYLD